MKSPEDIIKTIRESFIGAEEVYTCGSCVMLFRILKSIFPKALPYWSKEARHCITKIGNSYYDIRGKVKYTKDYKLDNKAKYSSTYRCVALPVNRLQRFTFSTPVKLTEL